MKRIVGQEAGQIFHRPGFACLAIAATVLGVRRGRSDGGCVKDTSAAFRTNAKVAADRYVGIGCVAHHAGFFEEVRALLLVVRCGGK